MPRANPSVAGISPYEAQHRMAYSKGITLSQAARKLAGPAIKVSPKDYRFKGVQRQPTL